MKKEKNLFVPHDTTPRVKFVKKAGMFCKTFWDENNKQKQEWIKK